MICRDDELRVDVGEVPPKALALEIAPEVDTALDRAGHSLWRVEVAVELKELLVVVSPDLDGSVRICVESF